MTTPDNNQPISITPASIHDLESKTPNIVRFLRKAIQGGNTESQMASSHVKQYIGREKAIREALSNRLHES